jgi:predicted Zn-dependent protease
VFATAIDQASVYPGGKMIIHSGVIPFCEDEDSLASLLSHEIAHVVASHAAERISQYFFFDMARKPALHVFYQLKASEYEMKGPLLVLGIYAIGLESLKARFRRDRESEADYIGLVIMARAGFDLRKACGYWERSGIAREARRVKEKGTGKVTSAERLLSSHPQVSLCVLVMAIKLRRQD